MLFALNLRLASSSMVSATTRPARRFGSSLRPPSWRRLLSRANLKRSVHFKFVTVFFSVFQHGRNSDTKTIWLGHGVVQWCQNHSVHQLYCPIINKRTWRKNRGHTVKYEFLVRVSTKIRTWRNLPSASLSFPSVYSVAKSWGFWRETNFTVWARI